MVPTWWVGAANNRASILKWIFMCLLFSPSTAAAFSAFKLPLIHCHEKRHLKNGAFIYSVGTTSQLSIHLRSVPPNLSEGSAELIEERSGSSASPTVDPLQNRGKVNEIDFCMAPSDVSLSRAYSNIVGSSSTTLSGSTLSSSSLTSGTSSTNRNSIQDVEGAKTLSLTRALNNASNRAVRRILLSRSWPSAEALNLSLRQVLSSSTKSTEEEGSSSDEEATAAGEGGIKCPVPRPILNILMQRRGDKNSIDSSQKSVVMQPSNNEAIPQPRTTKRGRSDAEWVSDQIAAFQDTYGNVPGYNMAEAYLECILNLATTGIESPKVTEVLVGGVYDESYRRLISVLKSVGAVFEEFETGNQLTKISSKLIDQDICLSMLDKIAIENEKNKESSIAIPPESTTETVTAEDKTDAVENTYDSENMELKSAPDGEDKADKKQRTFQFPYFFMSRKKLPEIDDTVDSSVKTEEEDPVEEETALHAPEIQPQDLGAVLLSAEEPSMTRQLNILANTVQRALLFGGDQELLVLYETLAADTPAFVQRWHPNTGGVLENPMEEERPGVQFLNCLVQLLKDCYEKGVVQDLNPPLPLTQSSYRNAYERLTASLVELGSGYIKPRNEMRDKILGTIPKTPKEEFGRFAEWEVNIRQISPDVTAYPDDLVGEWEVKDEVGGKTIGVSIIHFAEQGELLLPRPLKGLRWRLDPGPTHLDTCTFQVLNEDGAILQYKGFTDRGARLESRFSKRPIQIRGAVTFQMRDGESAMMSEGYKKDMLPIDYKMGTTRFTMTRVVKSKDDQ